MYAFEERNTTLVTIPENESNPEEESLNPIRTAKMESSSSFAAARQQQQDERGILLSRRLRRMKRKLFLEAVGEEYMALASTTTRGAPLRTLSTSSSTDSTEDN